MNSPITGNSMREVEYEGMTIYSCDESGGEFVSPDALAHIVRTRDERFDPAMREALADRKPTAGIDSGEVEHDFDCPACGGEMHIVNYAGDSGVHIDRCENCGGVWLDRHELEHIQVLMERWKEEAPAVLASIADELDASRRQHEAQMNTPFSGSRFAFVNAIMTRFLDAA